ncbi:MAG: response regulator [Desulfamplus sp.]|nr:response regulator [Desulfamplus sp.]
MQDSAKKNILIVDDTEANIDILVDILCDEYEISVAMDGKTAIEDVLENPPDLILLDIMMPGIDGYEVCRRLKEDPKTREIPVIFITALSQVEDETRGLRLGAVDYITKPINPSIVKARVQNHLELKQSREELKKQNQILQENIHLREEMDRIGRHDLKTPLNSIISLPRILLQDSRLGPDHIELLEAIEKSGHTMLRMINMSLDLFKMEKGTYQLQPVGLDVLRIINKIIFDLRALANAKSITFDLLINDSLKNSSAVSDDDIFGVLGEELLCYSMFANLIKNAVEASPENEALTVILSAEYAGYANICIHNKGVVPASIRSNFFEKYATAGKKSGTGLGTYSAKLMAETLGGSISMSTSETDGTAITVRLKQAKADNIAFLHSLEISTDEDSINKQEKFDIRELPPLKILIVDDDEYNRIILARYLNYPQLNIEFADNGQSAFKKFTEKRFDILFMDMEMPVMSGIDAAGLIRKWESEKSEKKRNTVIVALSGHDDSNICQTCLDSGFDDYLAKPVNSRQLRELLLRFFTSKDQATPESPNHAMCIKEQNTVTMIDVEIDADLEDLIPSFLRDKKTEIEMISELLKQSESINNDIDQDNGNCKDKDELRLFRYVDFEQIRQLGHRLKGGFNMYGFIFFGEISSAIEESAKRKDYDTIKNNMELLSACWDNIRIKYVNMN